MIEESRKRCSGAVFGCVWISFFRVKEINIVEKGRLAACRAGSECLRMLASAGGLLARAAEVFLLAEQGTAELGLCAG